MKLNLLSRSTCFHSHCLCLFFCALYTRGPIRGPILAPFRQQLCFNSLFRSFTEPEAIWLFQGWKLKVIMLLSLLKCVSLNQCTSSNILKWIWFHCLLVCYTVNLPIKHFATSVLKYFINKVCLLACFYTEKHIYATGWDSWPSGR